MTTDTVKTADNGGSKVAPTVQPIPDGAGLKLDDVRALISKVHNASLPADDPILIIVTICNGFLTEVEAMQKRHADGLSRLLAEKSDAYVTEVRKAVDSLKAALDSASAEAMKNASWELEKRLLNLRATLIFLTASMGVLTLVNIAIQAVR